VELKSRLCREVHYIKRFALTRSGDPRYPTLQLHDPWRDQSSTVRSPSRRIRAADQQTRARCKSCNKNTPNGIRTRAAGVKGRSPRPLDDGGSRPSVVGGGECPPPATVESFAGEATRGVSCTQRPVGSAFVEGTAKVSLLRWLRRQLRQPNPLRERLQAAIENGDCDEARRIVARYAFSPDQRRHVSRLIDEWKLDLGQRSDAIPRRTAPS
jgi:hypothetical protein